MSFAGFQALNATEQADEKVESTDKKRSRGRPRKKRFLDDSEQLYEHDKRIANRKKLKRKRSNAKDNLESNDNSILNEDNITTHATSKLAKKLGELCMLHSLINVLSTQSNDH